MKHLILAIMILMTSLPALAITPQKARELTDKSSRVVNEALILHAARRGECNVHISDIRKEIDYYKSIGFDVYSFTDGFGNKVKVVRWCE